MKKVDKLHKYAASRVLDKNKDIIWSATTNSGYFNYNGNTLRISDHLPVSGAAAKPGVTMSIIITSDPDAYVLQQHSTGRLSVVNYETAKEIIRSFAALSDIFRYPIAPFRLEKEFLESDPKTTILGIPLEHFSEKQIAQINSYATQANQKRLLDKQKVTNLEKVQEHLKPEKK